MASTDSPAFPPLTAALEAAGKRTEVLTGRDGSRILVLPHGGRVLGVFPPGSDANFLWSNPALGGRESARALFASPDWCNTGGDRTWLGPEADFFLPRYPETTEYLQPRQLDPGNYTCERAGNSLVLENRLTLRSSRTGEEIRVVIGKTIEPVANPRDLCGPLADDRGVAAAGYSLRCSLEVSGGTAKTAAGLWNLLQLPHGGHMLVVTRKRSEAVVYFGSIPADDLAAEDGLLRWTMRRDGEQKIGVRPGDAAGRAGYVSREGRELSLVIRDFTVEQTGLYVDAPWSAAADMACAFQACSVRTARLGSFSEMEYHAPAAGGASGKARSVDTSRVSCFRGPAEAINRLADRLLGARSLPEISGTRS
ncbi:MAG: DUF6786 family protein [Spirochaetia bacterium]